MYTVLAQSGQYGTIAGVPSTRAWSDETGTDTVGEVASVQSTVDKEARIGADKTTASDTRAFWAHAGLSATGGRLTIAGRDGEALGREHGTPLYVFDLTRITEQVAALQQALAGAGLRYVTRFSMKAQREPEVLAHLRRLGPPLTPQRIGADICSPVELTSALETGWRGDEISYTGTNVSDRDFGAICAQPIRLNVDCLSQLRRFARHGQGRNVGLRVNVRCGAGHSGRAGGNLYSSDKPSKFGFYEEQLPEAIEIARESGLTITSLHFHASTGLADGDLPAFTETVRRAAVMASFLLESGCPLDEINAGGGLETLDLDAYAAVLAEHLGPLGRVVSVEPGEFLFGDSAVLLAEVVTVEDRLGVPFVGLDAGWNVAPDRFIYEVPLTCVLCRDALPESVRATTITGNINEGDDVFVEDYPFAEPCEGDIVAILFAGGYWQNMVAPHCGRLKPPAVYFADRLEVD
jgi:diaminopimelate decarboxylase